MMWHWRTGQGMWWTALLAGMVILLAAGALGCAGQSQAPKYPTKGITIIVPWAPGSATDMVPRTLTPGLSEKLGVPVNVVNKPGGAGIDGTLEAMKAAPDGYTILGEASATSSLQLAWFKDLPYKVEERTFIARATTSPFTVLVRGDKPWKTVKELEDAMRQAPASFSWQWLGGGGTVDVGTAQLRAAFAANGVDVSKTKMVTFTGTGTSMPALAGGNIDVAVAGPTSAQALVDAGKVRYLATLGGERYKGLPNVPSTKEAGYPSVDTTYWVGFSGPPGLPKTVVDPWVAAVKALTSDPKVIGDLEKIGTVASFMPGDELKAFLLEEAKKMKAVEVK